MKGSLKPEMKLGADKKKVAMLGGLLLLLLIVWWMNRPDTPAAATSAPAPRPAAQPAPGIRTPLTRPRTPAGEPGSPVRAAHFGTRGQANQEFRPSLASETPIDP